jgi:acetyl esterase
LVYIHGGGFTYGTLDEFEVPMRLIAERAGILTYITPLNAESHADLPPAILVTNGFDPLRDVGHAYAQKLAAAGNDLAYMHNPDLTHGFPQFTRWSAACYQATLDLADLIKSKIG